MQVLYEQSKGAMSPSPDMRSVNPPNVLSSTKRNYNNPRNAALLYSDQKDGGYQYPMHSSPETLTHDASFIEHPPIPYQKRYRADVRKDSNSTSQQPSMFAQLRTSSLHPYQQSDTEPNLAADRSKDDEYYAMGKATARPVKSSKSQKSPAKSQEG